jgi:hypothetical protein
MQVRRRQVRFVPNNRNSRTQAVLRKFGRDFARLYADGRMAVLIRDGAGPVLEVSATFETKRIRLR